MRVTYFLTHPIQYQAPLIRHLRSGGVELEVVYGSVDTASGYYDAGFSRKVSWDVPLLEGYPHRLLPETRNFREMVRACREAIMATGAEAVWVHGWGPALSRAAWLAARQCRVPVILRGEAHMGCVRGGGMRRLAHRALLSLWFPTVRHFLAIGSANRAFYRAHGVADERITTMPYAVDNAFFQSRCAEASPRREALRERLQLPPGQPVILFCGKLIPDKSPEVLVEALGRMKPEAVAGLQPVLLMAGDGRMRGELEKQAAAGTPDAVRFLGFVNQTELPELYDLCDIFVLPSVFEPWGLVVNEVMNAAKPVLVSDRVGSGPDLVKAGVNGSIFKAGDVDELRRVLGPFVSDTMLRERAGEESHRIINHWGFDECLAGLNQALKSVAAERRGVKALN